MNENPALELVEMLERKEWNTALNYMKSDSSGMLSRDESYLLHIALKMKAPAEVIKQVFEKTYPDEDIPVSQPSRTAAILVDALRARQWAYVSKLLEKCPDAAKEKEPYTNILPLRKAIRCRAPRAVLKKLVEVYKDAVELTDRDGLLPLHTLVTTRSDVSSIKLLLDAYSNAITHADNWKRLPLHYAIEHGVSNDVLKTLIEADPDTVLMQDENGDSAIHYAVRFIDAPNFTEQEEKDDKVGKRRAENRNATSTIINPAHAVEIILNFSPECINICNTSGDLPLHVALRNSRVSAEVLSLLLSQDPELKSLAQRGMHRLLPLQIAEKYGTRPELNAARLKMLRKAMQETEKQMLREEAKFAEAEQEAGFQRGSRAPFIPLENRPGAKLIALYTFPELEKLKSFARGDKTFNKSINSDWRKKVRPAPPKNAPPKEARINSSSPKQRCKQKRVQDKDENSVYEKERQHAWDAIDTMYLKKVFDIARIHIDAQVQRSLDPNVAARLIDICKNDWKRRTTIWNDPSVAQSVSTLRVDDKFAALCSRVEQLHEIFNSLHPMNDSISHGEKKTLQSVVHCMHRARQQSSDITAVYPQAALLRDRATTLLRTLVNAGIGRVVTAGPIKTLVRSIVYTAIRQDGRQWRADAIVDIVRGTIKCEDISQMLLVVEMLLASDPSQSSLVSKMIASDSEKIFLPSMKMVEISHTFGSQPEATSPSLGNCWGFVKILLYFMDDPNKHIFEVRVAHIGLRAALSHAVTKVEGKVNRAKATRSIREGSSFLTTENDTILRSAVELLLATGKESSLLECEKEMEALQRTQHTKRASGKNTPGGRLRAALAAAADVEDNNSNGGVDVQDALNLIGGGAVPHVRTRVNKSRRSDKKQREERLLEMELLVGDVQTIVNKKIKKQFDEMSDRVKQLERHSSEKINLLLRDNKALREENAWMKRQFVDLQEQVRGISRRVLKSQRPMEERLEKARRDALRKGLLASQKAKWKANRERKKREEMEAKQQALNKNRNIVDKKRGIGTTLRDSGSMIDVDKLLKREKRKTDLLQDPKELTTELFQKKVSKRSLRPKQNLYQKEKEKGKSKQRNKDREIFKATNRVPLQPDWMIDAGLVKKNQAEESRTKYNKVNKDKRELMNEFFNSPLSVRSNPPIRNQKVAIANSVSARGEENLVARIAELEKLLEVAQERTLHDNELLAERDEELRQLRARINSDIAQLRNRIFAAEESSKSHIKKKIEPAVIFQNSPELEMELSKTKTKLADTEHRVIVAEHNASKLAENVSSKSKEVSLLRFQLVACKAAAVGARKNFDCKVKRAEKKAAILLRQKENEMERLSSMNEEEEKAETEKRIKNAVEKHLDLHLHLRVQKARSSDIADLVKAESEVERLREQIEVMQTTATLKEEKEKIVSKKIKNAEIIQLEDECHELRVATQKALEEKQLLLERAESAELIVLSLKAKLEEADSTLTARNDFGVQTDIFQSSSKNIDSIAKYTQTEEGTKEYVNAYVQCEDMPSLVISREEAEEESQRRSERLDTLLAPSMMKSLRQRVAIAESNLDIAKATENALNKEMMEVVEKARNAENLAVTKLKENNENLIEMENKMNHLQQKLKDAEAAAALAEERAKTMEKLGLQKDESKSLITKLDLRIKEQQAEILTAVKEKDKYESCILELRESLEAKEEEIRSKQLAEEHNNIENDFGAKDELKNEILLQKDKLLFEYREKIERLQRAAYVAEDRIKMYHKQQQNAVAMRLRRKQAREKTSKPIELSLDIEELEEEVASLKLQLLDKEIDTAYLKRVEKKMEDYSSELVQLQLEIKCKEEKYVEEREKNKTLENEISNLNSQRLDAKKRNNSFRNDNPLLDHLRKENKELSKQLTRQHVELQRLRLKHVEPMPKENTVEQLNIANEKCSSLQKKLKESEKLLCEAKTRAAKLEIGLKEEERQSCEMKTGLTLAKEMLQNLGSERDARMKEILSLKKKCSALEQGIVSFDSELVIDSKDIALLRRKAANLSPPEDVVDEEGKKTLLNRDYK
eukprot:g5869.t1